MVFIFLADEKIETPCQEKAETLPCNHIVTIFYMDVCRNCNLD